MTFCLTKRNLIFFLRYIYRGKNKRLPNEWFLINDDSDDDDDRGRERGKRKRREKVRSKRRREGKREGERRGGGERDYL